MKFKLLAMILMISTCAIMAQDQSPVPSTEAEAETKYQRNIKKKRINGVYIPRDYKEAIREIKTMSPDESMVKFKSAPEDMVVRKLHFGLGRWIRYNWNFYEGSRLSHSLKEMGVSHPDDMSTFLMILLHRQLNEVELNEMNLIAELTAERNAIRDQNKTVIKEETKKIEDKK